MPAGMVYRLPLPAGGKYEAKVPVEERRCERTTLGFWQTVSELPPCSMTACIEQTQKMTTFCQILTSRRPSAFLSSWKPRADISNKLNQGLQLYKLVCEGVVWRRPESKSGTHRRRGPTRSSLHGHTDKEKTEGEQVEIRSEGVSALCTRSGKRNLQKGSCRSLSWARR